MFVKFIFLICLPVMAYSATAVENAPVHEEGNRQLGYVCESGFPNLGLMKQGEVKYNFIRNFCGKAHCNDGLVHFVSCGKADPGPNCKLSEIDTSALYPDCCPNVICPA